MAQTDPYVTVAIWDNKQFIQGQQQYVQKILEASKVTQDSAASASSMGSGSQAGAAGMLAMGAAAGIAMAGVQAVLGVIKEATMAVIDFGKESILTAARVDELELVTQLLGQRAGFTEQQINAQTEAIKEAGIRTDVALNLQAQFARNNLDMAKATDVARVAQDAAILSNADSSETLQHLIFGITTYNKRVLRTAGLNIDVQGSFQRYAEEIGKTSTALTEQEKVQATMNAVLEEGARIQGVYETAMQTAGKQLRSLPRHFFEIKNALGAPFQNAFAGAIAGVTDMTKGIRALIEDGGALQPVMVALGGAAGLVGDAIRNVGALVKETAEGMAGFPMTVEAYGEGIASGVGMVETSLSDMAAGVVNTFFDMIDNAFGWGVDLIVSFADGVITGITSALSAAMNFLTNMLAGMMMPKSPPKIAPDIDKWGAETVNEWLQGFVKADFDALNKIQAPIKKALSFMDSIGALGEIDVGVKFADISKQLIKGMDTGDMTKAFKMIRDSAGYFADDLIKLTKLELGVADAVGQVQAAEERLKNARTAASAATDTTLKLLAEYNQMVGAAPEEALNTQLDRIHAAEEAEVAALAEEQAAEQNLTTQKESLDVMKEQLELQRALVAEMMELIEAQAISDPLAAGGAMGAGLAEGMAAGLGGGMGSVSDIMGEAVGNMKSLIQERLEGLWSPITEAWESDWSVSFENLRATWETVSGQLKTYYDTNVAPFLEEVSTWIGEKWGYAVDTWNEVWVGTLQPALQDLVNFIGEEVSEQLTLFNEEMGTNIPTSIDELALALGNIIDGAWLDFKADIKAFMTYIDEVVIPQFEKWLPGAIDKFNDALAGLKSVIAGVLDFARQLIVALIKIGQKGKDVESPPDYTEHSPAPFAAGLSSVNEQLKIMSQRTMPRSGMLAPAPVSAPVTNVRTANVTMHNNVSGGVGLAQLEAAVRNVIRMEMRP